MSQLDEFLAREHQRELYADARQWRIFTQAYEKQSRAPGWLARFLPGLTRRVQAYWSRQSSARHQPAAARPTMRELTQECETC